MARLTGAVLVALLALLVLSVTPAFALDRDSSEAAMLRLINHARTSRGLRAVKIHTALDKAALSHSRDMIAHDYFAHSSYAGGAVARRARGAGYSTSGWSHWEVGEVIAWGKSYRGIPEAIFKAWMHSWWKNLISVPAPVLLPLASSMVGFVTSRTGNSV